MRCAAAAAAAEGSSAPPLQALIFDCDGVIVESEGIHRMAYNAAFKHFNVRCPPGTAAADAADADGVLVWTEAFYDQLQNKVCVLARLGLCST